MRRKVVVLGGGVTGLGVAYALEKLGAGADVTVLERAPRLGGNIATEERDGYLLDGGPDSWVTTKPHATALARALGLEARMIGTRPENRRVYIAWKDGLYPLPEGMVLGIPTEIMPIAKSGLFSWDAKLRMGLEPMIPPRRWEGDEDESIGDFLARRLGDEVAERLAGPLLGGIFAGDARELSVRAAFPQLVEAERKHGSLVRAMRALRAARRQGGGGEASAFVSLVGGLGELIDALAARVSASARVRRGAAVRSVHARELGGYFVTLENGEALHADDVVLALPLPVSARVARSLDAPLADALGKFGTASTATVFLAYPRAAIAHPLDATGFLVPRGMRRSILAATWVSSKWEHRAPEGHVLVRVFFGGATDEAVLERDDADLVALARDDLHAIMGLDAAPSFTRVFRFTGASPQPTVGHMARVRAVKDHLARLPGVLVAGNGFDGTGIPDCLKQADAIAAAIVARAQKPGEVAIGRA